MIARRALAVVLVALTVGTIVGCQTVGTASPVRLLDSNLPAKDDDRPQGLYLSAIQQLVVYGKYYAALAFLDEFQRRYGPTGPSRKLRGDAWLALEQYDNAEREYSALAGALAGYGRHGLGRVMAARGDWPNATVYFQDAARLQPTNVGFLWDLGCALVRTDRTAEATFEMRKALELGAGQAALPQDAMSECTDEMRMLARDALAGPERGAGAMP